MTTPPRHPTPLSAERLTLGYPGAPPLLSEHTLHLPPGAITALVGPNGSGKSTLLKALSALLAPLGGRVLLNGRDLTTLGARDRARDLASLAQENGSPHGITLEALVQHGRHPHRGFFEDPSPEDRRAVERALELTHLTPLRHRPLQHLSGGQRQLAWFALALAQTPRVLLLDEPTTFLDLKHQLQVMEIVTRLRDEDRLTVVMVLHDINQAARYADHLIALRDGRVYAAGTPRDLMTPALLRDVFEIEADLLTTPEGHPLCVPRAPVAP